MGRGELGGGDFEQENDVTIRSDICSHPVETDIKGAIRINYLTDNVAFKYTRRNAWVIALSRSEAARGQSSIRFSEMRSRFHMALNEKHSTVAAGL